MVAALFDTNILIDYLQGYEAAAKEFARYDEHVISRITWMKVLVDAETSDEENSARTLLEMFTVVDVNLAISEEAIRLRKKDRLRLPDAIILATANINRCLLVTRNTKDFDPKNPSIRVPYKI